MSAATSVARIVENGQEIQLECHVVSVTQVDDKLRIVATGESSSGSWGISMRLGPGVAVRWPQAKRYHRLGVILEATDEASRRILDDVLTRKYGRGQRQSLFKPRGYDGGFTRKLRQLDGKESQFFLGDPGVDGDVVWNITGTFNPKKRTLVLLVGEARYVGSNPP